MITFEPPEQKQSYILLLKVLVCGMNARGVQTHNGISILQYTSMKMAVLLHKTSLLYFPMATTVNLPKQAYPAAEEASPAAVGKLFSEQM